MKTAWLRLKIALHVLRGRPVIFGIRYSHIDLTRSNDHVLISECTGVGVSGLTR